MGRLTKTQKLAIHLAKQDFRPAIPSRYGLIRCPSDIPAQEVVDAQEGRNDYVLELLEKLGFPKYDPRRYKVWNTSRSEPPCPWNDMDFYFYYSDGNLHWLTNSSASRKETERGGFVRKQQGGDRYGKIAGNTKGRRRIKFKGSKYSTAKLVWFFHKGEWRDDLAHIDGNQENCAIENLKPKEDQ